MGDLKAAILATNAVLMVMSSTAIACRIGRRVFLVRSFSWHDGESCISYLINQSRQLTSSSSYYCCCSVGNHILYLANGLYTLRPWRGQRRYLNHKSGNEYEGTLHQIIRPRLKSDIHKLGLASRIFYFLCNWAVKHSLLLFYATLTIDYYPRMSIYIMHFVAFAFGITCILFTLISCLPLKQIWVHPNGSYYSQRCINPVDFNYFNSCFMLANDIVLYAMPLVFTWKLHVSRPQRIAVNLLFALGGLVLAASGTRIYFVDQQARTPDFTYRFAMTMMCAVIENHLAIIVACAPSIKVILLHIFPSLELQFEKLVSKGSRSGEGSEFSFGTIAMNEVLGNARPPSLRTTTGESGKSKGIANARKWWQPPSSWEVNKEGKDEGCVREKTASTPAV